MKTLNEAIKARLEENRRAREEQERQEREKAAAEARVAAKVATEARAMLEKLHGFSLDDVEVTAVTYTTDASYYYINVNIGNDESYPHQAKTNSAIEVARLAEFLPKMLWEGLHFHDSGECVRLYNADLLSALIFAKYGTTEPQLEPLEQTFVSGIEWEASL